MLRWGWFILHANYTFEIRISWTVILLEAAYTEYTPRENSAAPNQPRLNDFYGKTVCSMPETRAFSDISAVFWKTPYMLRGQLAATVFLWALLSVQIIRSCDPAALACLTSLKLQWSFLSSLRVHSIRPLLSLTLAYIAAVLQLWIFRADSFAIGADSEGCPLPLQVILAHSVQFCIPSHPKSISNLSWKFTI